MANNILTVLARQAAKDVLPIKSLYFGRPVTANQADVIGYLINHNQEPIIEGLELRTFMDQTFTFAKSFRQWWTDIEPMDVWQEYHQGSVRRDMLPECIAVLINHEAAAMGTAPEALTAACIAAVVGAMGDGLRIKVKANRNSWYEHPRLWQTVIARSGSKKSPALRAGLAPLRQYESTFREGEMRAMNAYKLQKKQYDRRMRELEKKDDAPSIEDMTPPREPQTNRLILHDVTIEALSEVLRNQARGTMLYFDELTRWIGRLAITTYVTAAPKSARANRASLAAKPSRPNDPTQRHVRPSVELQRIGQGSRHEQHHRLPDRLRSGTRNGTATDIHPRAATRAADGPHPDCATRTKQCCGMGMVRPLWRCVVSGRFGFDRRMSRKIKQGGTCLKTITGGFRTNVKPVRILIWHN